MFLTPGYYITAELKAKHLDRIAETTDALKVLCKHTVTEPGCSMFTLHLDAKQPTRFLLWERFEDEAAFKVHFELAHTKDFIALDLTEIVQFFQTDVAAILV
jgi:quinol monooxygenase YgiN